MIHGVPTAATQETNVIPLPAARPPKPTAGPGLQLQTATPSPSSAILERCKAALNRLDSATKQTWADWVDACLGMLELQRMAMAAAKTEQPKGARYQSAINRYLRLYDVDRIHKTTRSIMVDVARNLPAIEAWRAALSNEERFELNHPRVVLTHWRRRPRGGSGQDDSGDPKPNPFLQGWIKSSDEQITAGLSTVGFSNFRERIPEDWSKPLTECAARLLTKDRDPDARITRAIQSALTHMTVADNAKTGKSVALGHESQALDDLRAALKALNSVKRSVRELDVGLSKPGRRAS